MIKADAEVFWINSPDAAKKRSDEMQSAISENYLSEIQLLDGDQAWTLERLGRSMTRLSIICCSAREPFTARISIPTRCSSARLSVSRQADELSAGRTAMTDEMQALCFFAGANSIFVGDTLLTADNPDEDKDNLLFPRLGIKPMELDPQ